jgi:signal transduction histidine kinase
MESLFEANVSTESKSVIKEVIDTFPLPCIFACKDATDINLVIYNQAFINFTQKCNNDLVETHELVKRLYYGDFCPTVFEFKGRVLETHSKRNFLGTFFYLIDQTEKRHLETIRSDFINNLAHELKTPLASMKGALETINEYQHNLDKKEVQHFIDIAIRHSNRLNEIFDNLSLLSDIERGRAELNTNIIDFKDVIDDAVTECQVSAESKKISISTSYIGDTKVNANFRLMVTALSNLISNAIKFSEPGSSILIKTTQDTDVFEVSVKDWGQGIPYEYQDRIFERFYRNDSGRSRLKGGSGLGLSLVKHIVKAHGGVILVDSKENQGSTFTIRLTIN